MSKKELFEKIMDKKIIAIETTFNTCSLILEGNKKLSIEIDHLSGELLLNLIGERKNVNNPKDLKNPFISLIEKENQKNFKKIEEKIKELEILIKHSIPLEEVKHPFLKIVDENPFKCSRCGEDLNKFYRCDNCYNHKENDKLGGQDE